MASRMISWNAGMTVAVALLVAGGVLVSIAEDLGSPLYAVGVGILLLSSAVYLGSRIWMLTRRHDR